jgi:hypothetical protein
MAGRRRRWRVAAPPSYRRASVAAGGEHALGGGRRLPQRAEVLPHPPAARLLRGHRKIKNRARADFLLILVQAYFSTEACSFLGPFSS